MSIKSKKWYENQIKALENAAKNTALLMDDRLNPYKVGSDEYNKFYQEISFNNVPIQRECGKIYGKLNELRAEYNLYYK